MNTLLKSKPLVEGDKVALSSPINLPPEKYRNFDQVINYLITQIGLDCRNFVPVKNTTKARVDGFNLAVKSNAKAIFPVAGNRYAEDIIGRIDYETFSGLNPIFCTFSAASVLLASLYAQSHQVVFYGPNISFVQSWASMQENPFTVNSFWNMLMQKQDLAGLPTEIAEYAFKWGTSLQLKNIISSGIDLTKYGGQPIPFIGEKSNHGSPEISGDLFPIFLQGLEKALQNSVPMIFKNKIMVIESDQIGFDQALKILQNINNMQALQSAEAIVVAGITHHPNKDSQALANELYSRDNATKFLGELRRLTGDNIPIIYGFPMGHGKFRLTVPMGVESIVNIETGDITLLESPFTES